MASVTSLDADMRNLRLGRYTPAAANETRAFVEDALGEKLAPGDLLDALKDGVALCKLVNLVSPSPGVKYKSSGMPFIQMENISHFLRACEMPPLNMQAHDRFLTVDLFESKDPAQVLQCLSAFSRQAHAANPARFPTTIGPRKAGILSPSSTGSAYTTNGSSASWKSASGNRASSPTKPTAARAMSPALTGGSTGSQNSAMSPSITSSWSRKTDEKGTAPAWNIHQYGYMGGASQGNQGISFGARRQITSQAPNVPSLAEKDRIRREKQAQEMKERQQADDAKHDQRIEREAEEAREQAKEEARWEAESRRKREEERTGLEHQKRQWEEQERRWHEEEEARRKEDAGMPASLMTKRLPEKPRVSSSSILRGQSLSQYQLEQAAVTRSDEPTETPEQARVRELEKQLAEAKEREKLYQAEREDRVQQDIGRDSRPSTATGRPARRRESEGSWVPDEREYLRHQWQSSNDGTPSKNVDSVPTIRPLPEPTETKASEDTISDELYAPQLPSRNDTAPSSTTQTPITTTLSTSDGNTDRPLPVPDSEYQNVIASATPTNRTDRFLLTNRAPTQSQPRISSSQEAGTSSLEHSADRDRRITTQQKTRAGGWAGKSLLEREMERERDRQKEWEVAQQESKTAKPDVSQGTSEGQSWDVNQYGYIGGDNMNKGSSSGSGIAFGGRRQIIGPRPQK